MLLNTWGEVLTLSFQNLWVGVVGFVPNLVIAIIVLILGWLVGAGDLASVQVSES
jgi:hypothetical protein